MHAGYYQFPRRFAPSSAQYNWEILIINSLRVTRHRLIGAVLDSSGSHSSVVEDL